MQENNANEAPQESNELQENGDSADANSDGLQWLVEWAIGGFIGLCFVGLVLALLPAVQTVRGPIRRPPCLNNLRQLSLAMQNYWSSNEHFPPTDITDENGKPMHSWRVLLLPYLEEDELYNSVSKPQGQSASSILRDGRCRPECSWMRLANASLLFVIRTTGLHFEMFGRFPSGYGIFLDGTFVP